MKKIKRSFHLLIVLFLSAKAFGQVTGVQTIPGTYASLAALVTDLNTVGVGPGGATVNVAVGYFESLSSPLVLTMATNTSSASRPLVIQKAGPGANPIVMAHTGTSTNLDAIFVLNGVDYVTINGIDLQENGANITPTDMMEWGYALLKISGTNGAQNNTIKNATVTLNKTNTTSVAIYSANHSVISTAGISVTSAAGTNSFNKFYNNTLQNCYGGYALSGYAAGAPYDFYDQSNQIGRDGISTNPSKIFNFGGSSTNVNAIIVTNQNGIKIFGTNITGGNSSTSVVNGINLVAGTNSNIDVYSDTITLTSSSTTSALTAINNTMGATGAGNTINIYNNVIDGCSYITPTTSTTATFRGIATTSTASYINIYNNKITNNTLSGNSDFAGIYCGGTGSITLMLNININGNLIDGNLKTGSGGAFYLTYANVNCTAVNFFNNQLTNNAAPNTFNGVYGYYNFANGLNEAVYNNTVSNLVGYANETFGLFVSSGPGTNKDVYGNNVNGITANSPDVPVGGINVNYATISNIYNNRVYNITNTNTGTTYATGVFGIMVGANSNISTNVTNNYVSDIKAPNMSNASSVMGIYLNGAAGSAFNAYYNTVYINATSSGTNFGTYALNCGVAPQSFDLRNNILVNTSTANGTGLTRALGRSSTSLANYALTSGYNCLYAGTPSASNLIFWDGTTSCQTLQSFKNLVGPREQASFATLPPFINVATAPYNLHLQSSIATQCEGGGAPIAGYTSDFDGTTRNVSVPDVGADEINGITVDIASPNIIYTPLTNSSVAATRSVTSFATVTDPSGVNTTIGTRPRLYYKLSTNTNTYNSNTSATNGWKYVEAINTSSPFSFVINYALLSGGGGVAAGNIIQYFVVAQDLNGTPIVGINSGGFTVQPSSVNLTAANFPLNNNINQYTIISAPLSGIIPVGTSETYTSLTNPGGIFQAINNQSLSGNVTLLITSDLITETGTFALNQWAEEGIGNYSVSIVPSAATVRNINGSSASNALIRFDGADRVTIDGRFAGSGQYLRFRNTSNSAPTIGYLNDAQNNTTTYAIVESGNTDITTTLGGSINIGSTTGLSGNDNITISFCDIRDRSDVAGTAAQLINCVGNTSGFSQYNNNCIITNNNFHDWFLLNSINQNAVNIGVGNSGFTITNNSFYQTATRTNTVSGSVTRAINVANAATVTSNGGFTVSGNFIGGTAPGATGSDMVLTVSGASVSQVFSAITMTTGLIPNSIQNNVIQKINFTTCSPSAATTVWAGINVNQGVYNIGTSTGNSIGDGTSTGNLKININTGGGANSLLAGILAAPINGSMNIRNNTIAGITIAGTATSGVTSQWIQVQGTPVSTTSVIGNTIGSTSVANSIQNTLTTSSALTYGIRYSVSSGSPLNLTNNTIANVTDVSVISSSVHYGVLLVSSVGGSNTLNVSTNVIRNLSNATGSVGAALTLTGISAQGFGGTNHVFTGNTIFNLNSNNTGAFSNIVAGIQTQGSSMGGTMNTNRIYGLTSANTGSPSMIGMYFLAGLNWSVNNNMVSLSNGVGTNNLLVVGIADYTAGTTAFNYNSVYIGGTASGALNTYSLYRASTSTISLRNNLLYNQRTGGTGKHYAIGNSGASPATNWSTSSSNYNAFVVADTTKVGEWGVGSGLNLATWRTTSGGDLNSIRQINTTVTSSALFANAATGDLHMNTSTYPEALGTPLAGITTDYDGNARSATFPTIGADELACSPIAFTIGSQTNVTCNGGNNGSVTLTGTGGNGLTYSWSPNVSTTASATGLATGTYTVTITNICGNSAAIPVTITQPAVIATTQSPVVCAGGSVTVGSNTYTTSGTYTNVLTAANGCDSTVTTNLTVSPAIASTQSPVVCAGGSVTVGSNTYTTSGTYTDVLTAVNGCDSTVTTNLTVNPAITTNQSFTVCAGGSVTVGSNTYTTSGTYTDVLTAVNGCDSTVTTNLTVSPAITSTQTLTVCAGGSVTVGSNTYTSSGTYTDVLTAANGCDSTVTTNLTVSPAITTNQSFTLCPGGSVTVGSNTYNTSGVYTDVLTAANGCDSTVTTNLTVSPAITSSQTLTVCAGGSVTVGSNTYSTSGTYTDVLTAAGGCDSTVTTNLTVSPAITTTQSFTVCAGGSVTVGSNTYSTSGTYTDVLTAVNGCDSTVTTNLTVSPAIISSQTFTVCAGGSVTVGSNAYTTSGTYTDVLTAANGCDSTVTTNLTVSPAITTSQSFTICSGASVTVGGNTYSTTGIYTDVLIAANGCDSTVTTDLTVLAPIDGTTSLTGFTISSNENGATYQWIDCGNGNTPIAGETSQSYTATANGSYAVIVTVNGCTQTSACVVISTIGLVEASFEALHVYPNPSNGVFTIEISDVSAKAVITNAIGEFVTEIDLVSGSNSLDLQREADGVYFVRITSDNKQQVVKIVKQL